MLTFIAIVAGVIAVVIVANWRLEFFKWDMRDEIKKLTNEAKSAPAPVEEESAPVVAVVEESAPVVAVVEEPAPVPVKIEEPVPVVETPVPTQVVEPKPVRAKDSKGRFVKDVPATTTVNEAWVGGVKPSKPVKRGPRKSKK